jgi:hypothetical protein
MAIIYSGQMEIGANESRRIENALSSILDVGHHYHSSIGIIGVWSAGRGR